MRLLFIANIFPPIVGGSARVYHEYCRRLGNAVSVLAPRRDYRTGMLIPDYDPLDKAQPYHITRIDLLRPLLRPETGLANWRYPVEFLEDTLLRRRIRSTVFRMIQEEHIGAVCLGELYSFGWLASEIRKRGFPVFQFIHGEELTTLCSSRRMRREAEFALPRMSGVLAVSSFTRDQVLQHGIPAERVHLIPNGVDTEHFCPGPSSSSITARHRLEGRRTLLTVSRVEKKKGHANVLRAMPELLRHIPNLVYLIVGDGTARRSLESLTQELHLESHVIFAGHVTDKDLPDYYRTCDLFVMPHMKQDDGDTEGFGLVFLEASACGKPVIGGRDGGVADAVVDGETGLLVNGADIQSIIAAVKRLLMDRGYARKLGDAGFSRARSLDWAQNAVRLKDICIGAPVRR